MQSQVQRNGYHEVTAKQIPDDSRRICPLIGNDELKLCVDARGVMHDFEHVWGSHPPRRISWSGRRHDRRHDRYNSNLFEWGILDLQLAGEADLPAVTGWRQRLHPRDGYVETEITRGEVTERTISFVHLEKNVIVFRREYHNLPTDVGRSLKAIYTLCQVGTDELPFRVTWTPGKPFENGIAADTVADGMWTYRGRVALFADVDAKARTQDNRLELDLELPPDGAVTVCLSLNDDLGDHLQLLNIPFSGWMDPHVRKVYEEVHAKQESWQPADYAAATDTIIADIRDRGFGKVFHAHRAAWNDWYSQAKVELPPDEEELRATLDTQLYTIRCDYTAWSSPANPFNTSWGAPYFWDERFPTEGLMRLGIMDMPTRTVEWRRNILPFSTMMSGGRGARYVSAATEPGSHIGDRNSTQFYEFFHIGVVVNYLYEYCRYHDDERLWRRYYPIFRECAEFYRHWLLIELPGNNIMLTWLVDVDESHYPVQDGPFAVCGAARILYLAWKTAEMLDIDDPEVPEWKRLGQMTLRLANHLCGGGSLDRDPSITTADSPASCYVDYELDDVPVTDMEVDTDIQAWRDAHRKQWAPGNQMKDGKTNITGEAVHMPFWSWGPLQSAHSAAMQQNADKALYNLRHSLKTLMDFAALNESAQVDLSDVHHPWFNTGAGAYVRALTRMLVYPRDDTVILLPGIPAGWEKFSFELPVHRGGRVAVTVEGGVLKSVRLAESRPEPMERVVHLPNRYLGDTPSFAGGVRIVEQTPDKTIVAVTVSGEAQLLN